MGVRIKGEVDKKLVERDADVCTCSSVAQDIKFKDRSRTRNAKDRGTMVVASLSIDPIFVVTNECVTITSAMRKNARWAQSGVASILGTSSVPFEEENDSLAAQLGLRSKNNNVSLVSKKRIIVVELWLIGMGVGQSIDWRLFTAES